MADALSLSATYSSIQGRARPLPHGARAPTILAALFSHIIMQRGLRFAPPQTLKRTFPDSLRPLFSPLAGRTSSCVLTGGPGPCEAGLC